MGEMNKLFIGDCLDVMHYRLRPNSVDLIYLDPPYNSGRNYDEFDDRWGSMQKYLDYMEERLLMCKRVLKETGSIYLHCDPTSSHYLKVIMDKIFGISNFRNEIIWCYFSGGMTNKSFSNKHDVILRYCDFVENRRVFNVGDISVPKNICQRCGNVLDKWNNLKKSVDKDGRVFRTIRSNGKLYKYYDDAKVVPSDVWIDISHLQQKDLERTGYPTQKPSKLLNRIISASSDVGEVVLDPFCGSGTALNVAEVLGRRWIGIDVNESAIRNYIVPRLEADITCKPFRIL